MSDNITLQYRNMHEALLQENSYQSLHDLIWDFQGKLDIFITSKEFEGILLDQITKLNDTLDNIRKGELFKLRSTS